MVGWCGDGGVVWRWWGGVVMVEWCGDGGMVWRRWGGDGGVV